MIIDGRKIAQKILREAKGKFLEIKKSLGLAAVMVGENSELRKFVELKKKAAEEIGIDFKIYEFPESITGQKLIEELNNISKNKTIHGMIIELPLPSHLDTQDLLNMIPEEKDVDVLSEKSQNNFFSGKSKILPPSVEAVKQIFEEYDFSLKGKTAAIFGHGILVGKPISHWLKVQGAVVSIIDEFTKEAGEISKSADIIISGAGKKNLITDNIVKDGAMVIDFGKDVDFEAVLPKAGLITPPTGGVGPIVVAAVLKNFVILWI